VRNSSIFGHEIISAVSIGENDRMLSNHRRSQPRPDALLGLLLIGFVAATGCGKGKLPRYPVHGSVNVDGKPADGAMVIFCPVTASEEAKTKRPFGMTGADGKFELTTIVQGDGAPPGDYKVLVQWPSNGGGDNRDGMRSIGPDRLKGKYMNLEKAELTATVQEASTDLPPFELKSK
jgi:hypothetical protein